MSAGYGTATIVERVAAATRAVIAGEAVYERDSVLFHEPAWPFPVLAALLRVAALNAGKLDVFDFGGSLGSTYRQCRPFLGSLAHLRWCVIEQPAFVTVGQAEFSSAELSFAATLADLPDPVAAPIVLASSVLQYLVDPAQTLHELSRLRASHLMIDRTPLCEQATNRLCIQHVPKHIYAASYPCWILSRSRLLDQLTTDWRLVCDFPGADGTYTTDDGLRFEFRGLIFERRS